MTYHAFGAVAYDLSLLLLAPLLVHQPSEVSKMQHSIDTPSTPHAPYISLFHALGPSSKSMR